MGYIDPSAIIGGPPECREILSDPAKRLEAMVAFPPTVHRSVTVQPFVTIDAGTVRCTEVRGNALLLAHSHIGHDAIIGDGAEISTGAVIGGHAEIGTGARVGLNATVLPFRKVGHEAVIGAGAVVTRDVPAFEVWAGNPARKLEDSRRDARPHTERSPETWRRCPATPFLCSTDACDAGCVM